MMNLHWDKKLLLKPQFWAILVPALLVLWMLPMAVGMAKQSKLAKRKLQDASQVEEIVQRILTRRQQSGGSSLTDLMVPEFQGVASAHECARMAKISPLRLEKGQGSTSNMPREGNMMRSENYNLNGVRLLEIARFIDYAENNFFKVTCPILLLTYSPAKTKDYWIATVHLEYQVR